MLVTGGKLVRRFEAAVTTMLLIVVAAIVLRILFFTVVPLDELLIAVGFPASGETLLVIVVTLGLLLLWWLLDGASHRATYGMRVRGLVFRTATGDVPAFGRCCARMAVGLILVPILPLWIPLAWIRGWHPIPADTLLGMGVATMDRGTE